MEFYNAQFVNLRPRNENTILKLWEMEERIINYVYLHHLSKKFEKIFFRIN